MQFIHSERMNSQSPKLTSLLVITLIKKELAFQKLKGVVERAHVQPLGVLHLFFRFARS
jgi:hypothetical protein